MQFNKNILKSSLLSKQYKATFAKFIDKEDNMKLIQEANRNKPIKPTQTLLDMQKLANEFGYEFAGYNKWYIGSTKPYLWINVWIKNPTNDENSFEYYLPRIAYDEGYNGGPGQFVIGTTSYGTLDMVKMRKFMRAQEDAYELVRQLSKFDLSKLPDVDA